MLDTNHTWTRRGLLREAAGVLKEAGIEAPQRSARWMLEEVIGCTRTGLWVSGSESVAREHVEQIQSMLQRRLENEPLQYILGHTEFFGLRLRVTPDVLIPRPETEQVVEEALRFVTSPMPRLLDVGTGSGCIAVALKSERPDAVVHACDVSEAALSVAAANAAAHELDISFFQADVLAEQFLQLAPKDLDLLISNPPYVAEEEAASLAPEVYAHEPHTALFAGSDPLRFYRVLARRALRLLRPGGRAVFEVHAGHGEAVQTVMREAGLEEVRLQDDLTGRPRIVTARHARRV